MKHIGMLRKSIAALVGIFLIGVGVSFNAMAHLGNDSVGIFYDGIRSILGLSQVQLGIASNIVNLAIVVLLLFIGRKYVSIGTVIYLVPYGSFVDVGTRIYQSLFRTEFLVQRISTVVVGCLLIFIGVAIYIAMDIGVDPMTGLALWIGEKLKWEYRRAKVLFDVSLTVIGFLLGGKLGFVTIVSSLIAGPMIQMFTNIIKRLGVKLRILENS